MTDTVGPVTDSLLDQLRDVGDPLTDSLLVSLPDPAAAALWISDRSVPDATLHAWLAESGRLPGEVDWARIERGQRFFSRVGPQALVALLCRGLPECYAGAKGAALLMMSGRIAASPRRRVMETARFVLAVMEPGRLREAVPEIQKVRLVHAFSRQMIHRHPDYRPELGVAANQEDMAGTLLAFSALLLDSLPRLGIVPTDEEVADYLYTWRVVGGLSGVDERLLPASQAGALALMEQIRVRQFRPSAAGRTMTAALLTMLRELVVQPVPWIRGLSARAPAALMRWLLPGDVADILDVPRVKDRIVWGSAAVGLGRVAQSTVLTDGGTLWEPLGRALIEVVYRYGSEGERPDFHMSAPHV